MNRFKKFFMLIILAIFICSMFIGCKSKSQKNYEGRTFYEIFVRSFNDSNGDGIGDLRGVTEKLDYLEDLGISGIWLMPINDSPSYHGYDVEDYYEINKDYGTMEDFEELIKEAHKRNIRVIMDLVINHTSTRHPWFVYASNDENSNYRDYYIWTDDMNKKDELSPMNTKAWSRNDSKNELYYSLFSCDMPDLNMDNPKVIEEVQKIAKFYLDKGVDGFRLDAAKWIFNEQEKNIEFWNDFNEYVKSIDKNAVLVGEVWDAPYNIEDYAKSLDSFFEFSVGNMISERIAVKSLGDFPDKYNELMSMYKKQNPNFILAPFLSNHDEPRIMGSFVDDFKMKMAATMYLTLPGTPYIYYGEEIGMRGGKPDELIREPFIWDNADLKKNTSWEPITNDTSKVALNIQELDENSLYNFYKDILRVRNTYESLRYGDVKGFDVGNSKLMVMERTYKKESTYVIINPLVEDVNITLPEGQYKTLYSNIQSHKESKETIKNTDINIKGEEIIILFKK